MRIIPADHTMPSHLHPRVIARGSAGEKLVYEPGDGVRVTASTSMRDVDAERAIMSIFDVCTQGADVLHRETGAHDTTLRRDRFGRYSSNTPLRSGITDRVYVTPDAVTVRCTDGSEMQVAVWGTDVLPAHAAMDAAVRDTAQACINYEPKGARHTRHVGPYDGVAAQVRARRPYGEDGLRLGGRSTASGGKSSSGRWPSDLPEP